MILLWHSLVSNTVSALCTIMWESVSVCLQKGNWDAEKVISVPSKKVEGWILPQMPGKYGGKQL